MIVESHGDAMMYRGVKFLSLWLKSHHGRCSLHGTLVIVGVRYESALCRVSARKQAQSGHRQSPPRFRATPS